MVRYIDVTDIAKQIADFKKIVKSPNSDYMTGYLCALSVTEGMIANTPTANVAPIEEVERLQAEKETLEIYYKDYKYKNKELTAFNRRWAKECAELQDECDQIKADTVQVVHAMIKERCLNGGIYPAFVARTIEQVEKEMLEGTK